MSQKISQQNAHIRIKTSSLFVRFVSWTVDGLVRSKALFGNKQWRLCECVIFSHSKNALHLHFCKYKFGLLRRMDLIGDNIFLFSFNIIFCFVSSLCLLIDQDSISYVAQKWKPWLYHWSTTADCKHWCRAACILSAVKFYLSPGFLTPGTILCGLLRFYLYL